MNWSTVGPWCDWGVIVCASLYGVVQGSKLGYWRRIWNWPFKIGTGSCLLGFLLFLIPHSALAVSLACVFFCAAIVSFMVFVAGFLLLVMNENKTTAPRRTTN